MKASQFNFQTQYEPTGETLLFNTLTAAFWALDADAIQRVERLLQHPEDADEEPDLARHLIEQGYLVEDDVDETAIVVERSRLGIADPNRLDVIVMPNMNCNLACTYCYETHEKSEMEDATAARLLTWLEAMIPRFKVVLLSWFGGEPLLSYRRVVEVQRRVREICASSDTTFSSHITTNGYLLSAERAAELISLDLFSYQITLDGAGEVHDAMRPLRSGGPTFERIRENVCALARTNSHASIKLRVNYDDRNLDRIPDLLRCFPEDVRPQLDIVYERIFGQEYSKFLDPMPARRVGTTIEDLYQLARELGFSVTMNPLRAQGLTYCYADRRSQFVINYNGDVFKCTVDKFQPKDRLGWLQDDGSITWEGNRLDGWHAIRTFEDKCYECTFMPMCMGGCRKLRGREGSVGDNCKLPFAGFDRRLQHQYAREIGDSLLVASPSGGPGILKPLVTSQ